ncbi:nucleoside hydrolase [Variovorax rhizosphaerae]|uniref:nucleoside hydrolase n=1 Tax=Variovorax rhizosphaerae TaxID=1836200 RepID=UPI003BF5CFD9
MAAELFFMGGSFRPVAADNHFAEEYRHNPRHEFNLRWDPEAASLVLKEPWRRIAQIPVDATRRTHCGRPTCRAGRARAGRHGATTWAGSAAACRCGTKSLPPCGWTWRWARAARPCWWTWTPPSPPTTAVC